MKVKSTNIVLFVAIICLCQCKKDKEVPYPSESIVKDNAQAAVYFHTVFREAENAWALIDSVHYEEGVYKDPANTITMYKELKYTESTKTVVIDYNAWKTNNLLLIGRIIIDFGKDSYRRNAMPATVKLSDFSINGQDVVGESTITFTGNSEKDLYAYSLIDGTAIRERGVSMPVLISGTISKGQYERIEGRETFSQEDDVWAYQGVMKGQLHNDPNLNYTNTVLATSMYTVNGESRNGKIHYCMDCKTARQGMSQIKISGRSDITFAYDCSGYDFLTVTHVD